MEMKKAFLGFLILAALVLICAGTALAEPLGPAGGGLSVFADYDSWWDDSATVGVGCGFSDNLTVGVCYIFEREEFGLYTNLALGPFRVNAQVALETDWFGGLVSGLYVFDLDPIALGVGGGSELYDDGFDAYFFELAAEFKLDALTVYGSAMFFPDYDDYSWKIGVSCMF